MGEAEAWGPAGLYGHAVGAPLVAHAAVATSHTTIKSDCREVTKEVCVNTPKKVSKTVPITTCNLKQTVDCHAVTKKIPKKNCEPVETKVTVPVATVAHAAPVAVAHAAPVAVAHAAPISGVAHGAPIAAGHIW